MPRVPSPPDGLTADGAPAEPLSRRHFLSRTCLLGAALAVGAPLATALAACDTAGAELPPDGVTVSGNTITLDLTRPGVSGLGTAGGFLYVAAADTVIVNVDGSEIRAFSSVCPHEGRPVRRFTGGRLECPSHGSYFDPATGAQLAGPAHAGLQAYAVSRTADVVTVTKT